MNMMNNMTQQKALRACALGHLVALLCMSGSAIAAKDAESGKKFPPMPVLAPGALTAHGANGRAYLNWNPAVEDERVTGWQVYRSTDRKTWTRGSEVEPENQKKLIAFHIQFLAKHGERDSLRFINLRRSEPVTLLLKTGSVLAAGEAERIKETDKTETLLPWVYEGVMWQYADGREVRYPGYEDILAGASR